ncbi:MAG: hypothetical protein II672_06120 [Oscillospiraceae bacterium]|nr:hypothetical protein [Oscillospiraceae bacterium]
MSKITASKNTFDDGTTLYDEYGNVVGRQYKDSFGDGVTTYDQYGNTVARSYSNSFDDGVTTYDQYGNRIATTYGHSFDDGSTTYDQYGNRIADTYQNTFDPGSSTTYFTGAAGAGYAAGASSYSSGYDSSYSSGYTSSYIPTGGYAGGYSPPDPRTLRKNRICGVFVTLGIIGLVLDFIYGLVGIIKPDLISLDLGIFTAVYAACTAAVALFESFEMGEFEGGLVGGLAVASLLFFYICGQATYNANGYSYGSAQMAWSTVKHIAFIGLICVAGGMIIGLVLEKAFSGTYRNGNLGLAADVLSFLAAAGTCWSVFTAKTLIQIDILTVIFAALLFMSVLSIVLKRGSKGIFSAVIRTLIMTGFFTALLHEYRYRMGLGSLISALTSMISLKSYIIFGCSGAAGMILGAVLKKMKNKQN